MFTSGKICVYEDVVSWRQTSNTSVKSFMDPRGKQRTTLESARDKCLRPKVILWWKKLLGIIVQFLWLTIFKNEASNQKITIIKGSLVSELPTYGRLSWSASISIIMSTTSSCQTSIIKVVRKCNSSAAREYTWKHFRARNSAFFRVNWLPWSPK